MRDVKKRARKKKGASQEAILRQKIERAPAPRGMPWIKMPDGSKGNAVDAWAWEKFKESGLKDFPSEQERLVALDNGTISRWIESKHVASYVDSHVFAVNMKGEEVTTIDVGPSETNKTKPGVEWDEAKDSLKRLMDEAQEKRDHAEAIRMIVADNLPATEDNYQKCRADILRRREIERIFREN